MAKRFWNTHELKKTYDVVIIGGGVHGLATAYYLAKMGMKNIAVLEAKFVGYGGSGRNTAILRSTTELRKELNSMKKVWNCIEGLLVS